MKKTLSVLWDTASDEILLKKPVFSLTIGKIPTKRQIVSLQHQVQGVSSQYVTLENLISQYLAKVAG